MLIRRALKNHPQIDNMRENLNVFLYAKGNHKKIFENLAYLEGRNQVGFCNFGSDSFLQIREFVCYHVANPPGLILSTLAKSRHHQLFHILKNVNKKLIFHEI